MFKKPKISYLILILLFNISNNIALADVFEPSFIRLIPDKESFFDEKYLILNIFGESEQKINVAEISIKYDPKKISFDSLAYNDEFCSINVFENIDDNEGNIRFACGAPNESANFSLAKIKFIKKDIGWTNLTFDKAVFYPNDGQGESILPAIENQLIYLLK